MKIKRKIKRKYFLIKIIVSLCICIQVSSQNNLANTNNYRYQEIDFALIRNQIIFKATVNGLSLNMMLDTGGNPSLISTEAGTEFNWIDTTKFGYASGVGSSKIKIYAARIEGLEIKKLKFEFIDAIAMDLSEISTKLGIKLSGILGYSFLSDQIIQIDYPARKLRIYPAETKFTVDEDSNDFEKFTLKFPPGKTIPLIENLKINNFIGNATLDTGSSLNLDIKSYLMDSLGLDRKKLIKSGDVYGASGQEEVSQIEIDLIQIGSINVEGVKMATIIEEEVGEPDDVGINIGNGLMKEFVVTFDYINKVIMIKK